MKGTNSSQFSTDGMLLTLQHKIRKLPRDNNKRQEKVYALLNCIGQFFWSLFKDNNSRKQEQCQDQFRSHRQIALNEGNLTIINEIVNKLVLPIEALATYDRFRASLSATQPSASIMELYSAQEFYSVQIFIRMLIIKNIYLQIKHLQNVLSNATKNIYSQLNCQQKSNLTKQNFKNHKYEIDRENIGIVEEVKIHGFVQEKKIIKMLKEQVCLIIFFYECQVLFKENDLRVKLQLQMVAKVMKQNTTQLKQAQILFIFEGINLLKNNNKDRIYRKIKRTQIEEKNTQRNVQQKLQVNQIYIKKQQCQQQNCNKYQKYQQLQQQYPLIQNQDEQNNEIQEQKSPKDYLNQQQDSVCIKQPIDENNNQMSAMKLKMDPNTLPWSLCSQKRMDQNSVKEQWVRTPPFQEQSDNNSNMYPVSINNSVFDRHTRYAIPPNYRRFNFNRATLNWRPHALKNSAKRTRVIYDADSSCSRHSNK